MATLRSERESRELSQEDVASRAGISKTTLIRAEKGERVSRRTARDIARVFGLKPAEIDDLNYAGKRSAVMNVQSRDS